MIWPKPNNCHSPRARTTAPPTPCPHLFRHSTGGSGSGVCSASDACQEQAVDHPVSRHFPTPHTPDKLPEFDAGTGTGMGTGTSLSQYATRTSSFAGADAKSVAAAVAVVAVVVPSCAVPLSGSRMSDVGCLAPALSLTLSPMQGPENCNNIVRESVVCFGLVRCSVLAKFNVNFGHLPVLILATCRRTAGVSKVVVQV